MDYRIIPNTALSVSRVCLGTMTFGDRLDESGARQALTRRIFIRRAVPPPRNRFWGRLSSLFERSWFWRPRPAVRWGPDRRIRGWERRT